MRNELRKLESLATELGIDTAGYSAIQICDECEWYLEDLPGDSPTFYDNFEDWEKATRP